MAMVKIGTDKVYFSEELIELKMENQRKAIEKLNRSIESLQYDLMNCRWYEVKRKKIIKDTLVSAERSYMYARALLEGMEIIIK